MIKYKQLIIPSLNKTFYLLALILKFDNYYEKVCFTL